MHDSFQPVGGMVPLVNMLLGEITYGGLGSGLYGMIFVALITLVLGGLMIGRTPEHLGKQIGPPEMKIIAPYTLIAPATILGLTAFAVVTKAGVAGLTTNAGAHGLTEIAFAYASAFANNGQNMAGLSANTPFYNITTIVAMLNRPIWPGCACFGFGQSLCPNVTTSKKLRHHALRRISIRRAAPGDRTACRRTQFFSALALGPIVEHLSMHP
jgi:K+-transporting ATPase ATPase A chain